MGATVLASLATDTLAQTGNPPPQTNWDSGQVRHLLPTVSDTKMLIKASFHQSLTTTPTLHVVRGNLLRIAANQQRLEPALTICLVTDPNRLIVDAAETLGSEMFAKIRVRLQWHGPPVCPAGAGDPVFLMLETHTPDAYFPGALGVALPLEGSHAWVFYDRALRASPNDAYLAALLAHVMAHEIAHVLQRIIRHSGNGIPKVHWTGTDLGRMVSFPLMFTREDAILIHQGLEERRARLVSTESGGVQTTRSDEIRVRKERPIPVP